MIDPYNFISYPMWLSLPQETRYKIAAVFNIAPNGTRQTIMGMHGGEVVSDSFLHKDLAVITKASMEKITGFKSDDFNTCFKVLLDHIDGKLNKQNNVQQEEQTKVDAGAKAPARRGRPRRQA
jgi:hypothetical protein